MQYVIKYKLFFHSFNKQLIDTIKVNNRLSSIYVDKNYSVYNEPDLIDYVKTIYKQGEIEKLFKIPEKTYCSEYREVDTITLKILRC